jgi:hypothetical protein
MLQAVPKEVLEKRIRRILTSLTYHTILGFIELKLRINRGVSSMIRLTHLVCLLSVVIFTLSALPSVLAVEMRLLDPEVSGACFQACRVQYPCARYNFAKTCLDSLEACRQECLRKSR